MSTKYCFVGSAAKADSDVDDDTDVPDLCENDSDDDDEAPCTGHDTKQAAVYAGRSRNLASADDGTVEAVAGNEAKYTSAERERAKEAVDLVRKIGFYSPSTVLDMMRHGGIAGCPLSSHDINIYGKSRGYHAGKMKQRTAQQLRVEQVPPLTTKEQVMHCDIMFVGKIIVFVASVQPLDLAFTYVIEDRSTKEVARAIRGTITTLQMRDCHVHTIVHDPERGIASCRNMLPGVIFEASTVQGHVIFAERLIQELKECMRSVIHSLSYPLVDKLTVCLVAFATIRRNSVFHRGLGLTMSPRDVMLGRKVDYRRELVLGFGDFVNVYDPKVVKNTMSSRVQEAIAIYPTGGLSGAWVFYHLKSGKQVVRSTWNVVPMLDMHIKFMRDLALPGAVPDIKVQPRVEELLEVSPDMVNTADSGGVDQVPAYVVGDREELSSHTFGLFYLKHV